MKCKVEIDMSNAAFDENIPGDELARIFRVLGNWVSDGGPHDLHDQAVRDVNGNPVGMMTFSK
jgi:hypothetical protein